MALVGALELQELVVAAARAVGIGAADRRARFINGAAARLAVEHHAHRVEVLVLLVAQQAQLFLGIVLGEALLGLRIAQAEMPRQALDVARRDLDLRIAAAEAGTLGAGIFRPHRHWKRLAVFHLGLRKSRGLYASRMTFFISI